MKWPRVSVTGKNACRINNKWRASAQYIILRFILFFSAWKILILCFFFLNLPCILPCLISFVCVFFGFAFRYDNVRHNRRHFRFRRFTLNRFESEPAPRVQNLTIQHSLYGYVFLEDTRKIQEKNTCLNQKLSAISNSINWKRKSDVIQTELCRFNLIRGTPQS